MHRTQHRVRLTTAAGIAALARGAVPASADSDGCSGAAAENAPRPVVVQALVPVAPQQFDGASPARERLTPRARTVRSRRVDRVRAVTVAQRSTFPRGATGTDGVLALLAAGAVVLVATGGGLVAIGRRVEP